MEQGVEVKKKEVVEDIPKDAQPEPGKDPMEDAGKDINQVQDVIE